MDTDLTTVLAPNTPDEDALQELIRRVPRLVFATVRTKALQGSFPGVLRAERAWFRADEALGSHKKLSGIKRTDLRRQRQAAAEVLLVLAHSPEGKRQLLATVAVLQKALYRLEKARRGLALLSKRLGVSENDLFVMLRAAETNRLAQKRLERRFGLTKEQLEATNKEIRRLRREKKGALELICDDEEVMRPLLERIREQRRTHRAQRAPAGGPRGIPSPEQSVIVSTKTAQILRRAPRLGLVKPRLTPGRVSQSSPRSASEFELGSVETGTHGERLCFERFVWPTWLALLRDERPRTVVLLRRIAAHYWTLDDELQWALEDLEAETGTEQLDFIRGLLWPASTTYGDAVGFDMIIPSTDGLDWSCVEVKSTAGPETAPFVLTRNEWAAAQREGARYAVYRLGRVFEPAPVLRIIEHLADQVAKGTLSLEPMQYVVASRHSAGVDRH